MELRTAALLAALAAAGTVSAATNAVDKTPAADAAATPATPVAKNEKTTVKPAKLTPTGRAALRRPRNMEAMPTSLGSMGGPRLAAEEAYILRAYPATDIPVALTLKALAAAAKVKGKGPGKNKWELNGPSEANMPAVLTFSGADYTTSGRVTSMAITPGCSDLKSNDKLGKCIVWAAAAGGGVWRSEDAFKKDVHWKFVSDDFATNAIGALTYDAANGVLYAGTGEPNASGDSEAGLGLYKSTDGGNKWTKLAGTGTADAYSGPFADARAISGIVVDRTNANVLYVSTTRGVRGISSVSGGATPFPPAPTPPFGLWKSTDGGATFSFLWNGGSNAAVCDTVAEAAAGPPCSTRGVNHVELDPSSNTTIYAAAFQQGVWRSTDGGATWAQIRIPVAPFPNTTDRAEFAVTKLPNGKTRIYVGDGTAGSPAARFFRSDDATAAVPAFTDLTTTQNIGYCTGQCWYDNFVYTPPGYPDIVYLGGSFDYNTFGATTNGRAVLLSQDAGASFTDQTWDATSPDTPNGMHPDQHAIVTHPDNPLRFIEGSDGGVIRSSGALTNASGDCAGRGLIGASLALCQQLLSAIPTQLEGVNKGLSTLQFQSLSMDSTDSKHLMGGTQDNGTFETTKDKKEWPMIIYGDGGQSGFATGNPALRFNTFTNFFHDVNFRNGDPTAWVIASAPIVNSGESALFYPPIIADPSPAAAQTIFQGSQSVWRTQDWGGNQAYLEANCPEFITSGAQPGCGDFVRLGATTLTTSALGDRDGGNVGALARTAADTNTLWAATTTGRLFVSKNADNATNTAVTFIRIDTLASNDPQRFISGIAIDPANANKAYVSYSGYDFNTPSQPGHVFVVTFDPAGPSATWTDMTHDLGDLPATGIAFDSKTGDLYAASDFGVNVLPAGGSSWIPAGQELPAVEVAGLTINVADRVLYAATHGRSAWKLKLP